MKRFEYQVLIFTYSDIESELNRCGQDGWELVAVDGKGTHYLKRQTIE